MALTCDPSALPNAARCFDSCIPPGMHLSVQTYLLAQIVLKAGGISSANPDALMAAAQCWESCIGGNSMSVQNYMLAVAVTSMPLAPANLVAMSSFGSSSITLTW